MTSHGFPALGLGVVDLWQRLRMVAWALSSDESADNYEGLMRAATTACKEALNFEATPRYGISDAAASIRKAGVAVWPSIKWLQCFMHINVRIRWQWIYVRTFAS